jgi:hypothetical protein
VPISTVDLRVAVRVFIDKLDAAADPLLHPNPRAAKLESLRVKIRSVR